MKLDDIIKRVQRQFGDDVQAQITIDDIVRWVNDACLEIATSNSANQSMAKGAAAVTKGKNDYILPTDLLTLRAVRANGFKLVKTTFEQLEERPDYLPEAVGEPLTYYVYDDTIYLYPTPSETLGNLDIYYVKAPAKLVATDLEAVPEVPTSYHPRIVEYCIAQAAELDDDIGHYQLKMAQFKENLLSLKGNAETPESDSYYPSITFIGEGY